MTNAAVLDFDHVELLIGTVENAADANANGVPDTCEFARGDFDLDGIVGGGDLAILLSFWGDPNGSVADLSGDGAVTAEDLALLLSLWGG